MNIEEKTLSFQKVTKNLHPNQRAASVGSRKISEQKVGADKPGYGKLDEATASGLQVLLQVSEG